MTCSRQPLYVHIYRQCIVDSTDYREFEFLSHIVCNTQTGISLNSAQNGHISNKSTGSSEVVAALLLVDGNSNSLVPPQSEIIIAIVEISLEHGVPLSTTGIYKFR